LGRSLPSVSLFVIRCCNSSMIGASFSCLIRKRSSGDRAQATVTV